MAISDEDIAEVRAKTDLVALIGEKAALKRQGRRWVGLCPFHQEKSPSFSVNAEEGFYHCFGCKASGDAITFVRETDHLDFLDAVRFLAEKAGVTLHEDDARSGATKRRGELYQAMERAIGFYHERLLSAPDAGRARDYLRQRGYDGTVVRQFRLGWAPDAWDELARHLKVAPEIFEAAGLGFTNKRGKLQDSFRNRVVFPICDTTGRPIAIGARILPLRPGEEPDPRRGPEPKYKNSTETAIYVKRKTLYALNWAKDDVIKSGEIIVCEGYTDVIGCFEAGLPRAVATCGTALAEEHFKVMTNFAKRIVLAYDADAAGQSATTRVYEWERTHEVDVVVAALPEGADPGELAQRDPDALRAAISSARPFLEFRLDRVFAGAELSTPEHRARIADRALGVIAEHPSDLVADQYLMTVADRCRLDAARLRPRLEELRRDPSKREALGAEATREVPRRDAAPHARPRPADPSQRPGLEGLRIAVHRPEAVAHRIEPFLFTDRLQRRAIEALFDAASLQDAVEEADEDVATLLRQLIVEEPALEVTELGDPVDAVVAQLLRLSARRALDHLSQRARLEPASLKALNADAAKVKRWLEELEVTGARERAETELLAWLTVEASRDER